MPGTLSSSSRHSATHRARRCELEASALSSSASPLRPDKAAFLRRARAASSMGSGRGGGHNNGGGDDLDGRSHEGEDGLEVRLGRLDGWPRWRHPRGAGKRRGCLDGDLDAARASSTERLDGDLHAMQAPQRRPRCSKCRCRLHPPHEPHTVEEPRDVHPSALPK
jgi:hypothetical protein